MRDVCEFCKDYILREYFHGHSTNTFSVPNPKHKYIDDTGEVTFEEFLLFIFKSSDILNSQVTKGIQDRVRASVTFQKNLQEELEKMGLDREY